MAQVEAEEKDLLDNGGGRSVMGNNLKVFVLFPNAPVTIVQDGGLNNDLPNASKIEEGGEDTDLQTADAINDGGEDTI